MACAPSHMLPERNPVGRPKIWTDEKIKEEAAYLVKWAELEDSLVLASCYGKRGYSYDYAMVWERVPEFSEAKKLAKTLVGARREKGALLNQFDSAIVRSSMGSYDPEHKAYLKEMKKDELLSNLSQEDVETLSELIRSRNKVKE